MNKDLSEAVRYQDVIESLKVNKEIEGLAKSVGKACNWKVRYNRETES